MIYPSKMIFNTFNITVNGKKNVWKEYTIDFYELASLAKENHWTHLIITYYNPKTKAGGVITRDDCCLVMEGMVFKVLGRRNNYDN